MNKCAFTPGPWRRYEGDALIIVDHEGASLGEMSSGSPRTPRSVQLANAALAAAAPELYEALSAIIDEDALPSYCGVLIDNARAALAKATAA